MSLRIVVGEDDFLVRQGIVTLLREGGLDVVGEAGDLDTLRAVVDETWPDVVVTDIRMPPTGTDEGLRLATELDEARPSVGILLLSLHARPAYAIALFERHNPHRAYLLKERVASPDALLGAVHAVAEGRPQLDPQVVELLLDSDRPESALERLTERETEVIALIADGGSNAAIAEKLGITTRAVERHVNAIFAKLGLSDPQATNRRVLAALLYARGR